MGSNYEVKVAMLSEKAINEFIELSKKEFGIDLERREAEELANGFLNLMRVVYRPIELESGPKKE